MVVVESSFTGLIKMVLILIGAVVALRFLGQLMIAKRNLDAQGRMQSERESLRKQQAFAEKNAGKVTVINRESPPDEPFEDTNFEEIKE
jgi:hypothetical protein